MTLRRNLHSQLAITAAGTALGMFVYEAMKQLILPKVSIWQSHFITIIFGTVVATVATWRALRIQDILHRRMLEESTERRKLGSLIAALSDVILLIDAGGRYLEIANSGAERLFRPPTELLGRRIDEVFPADEARRFMAAIRQALATNARVELEYSLAIDDRVVWFDTTVSPDGADQVVWVARDITRRKMAEEALRREASHDTLTGLPNRAYMDGELARVIARARRRPEDRFGVLFVDCDRFKVVNDSLGHHAGDALLRSMSERLRSAVRPGDLVARLGGDEFTILVENVGNLGGVIAVADRIQREMARPFDLHGHEVFTSASIGIVLSNPAYAAPDEMLRDADIAMYSAKLNGRAQRAVFTPELRAGADMRFHVEAELRRGIERKEFVLYYQPIVRGDERDVVAVEGLLRWRHPTRGLLAPAQFLSAAEESGLLVPIGKWVLQEACRQAAAWRKEFGAGAPAVSVNLSPRQLTATDTVDVVRQALEDNGLPPSMLKLEITEDLVVSDAAGRAIAELRRLGVDLLMDDFGTGRSSLGYLHHLPVTAVKIDRYFVQRLNEEAQCYEIVRTIVALAEALNVEAIAEGVESETQFEALRALGCTEMQGFLFGEPAPAAETTALLLRRVAAYP